MPGSDFESGNYEPNFNSTEESAHDVKGEHHPKEETKRNKQADDYVLYEGGERGPPEEEEFYFDIQEMFTLFAVNRDLFLSETSYVNVAQAIMHQYRFFCE